jgi:general secretion pathway protein G
VKNTVTASLTDTAGRLEASPMRPAQRGFSLMELVVTLALLGLLASLAAPLAEVAVQRSKERQLRNGLYSLRHAIDAYKRAADSGLVTSRLGGSGYPASLDVLTGAAATIPATTAATPATTSKGDDRSSAATVVFLRELPRDPFADPSLSAAATWGLRSYASPPDQPAPGDDVFDVYTRAEGKGLNGVAYRDW